MNERKKERKREREREIVLEAEVRGKTRRVQAVTEDSWKCRMRTRVRRERRRAYDKDHLEHGTTCRMRDESADADEKTGV